MQYLTTLITLAGSDKKILIEQGGDRSGKTFNILIWIIFDYCQQH